MKKSLRMLALVLAVLMLAGCQSADPTEPETTGPADYTVKVVDPLGQPVEKVGVKFITGGEQVAVAITDENGTVTKQLDRDDYTLELTFLDIEHSYYYVADTAKLSATQTSVEIVTAYVMGETYDRLSVSGGERPAYTLEFAGSNVTITGILDHSLDGTFAFTEEDGRLTLENSVVDIQLNLSKKYIFQTAETNGPQRIVDENNEDVTELADGTYTVLSNEYTACHVEAGCTYVKLNEAGNNYFVFTPTQAGIYEFSVVGEGTVGSHGTPNYAYATSDVEIVDGAFQETIMQSMIGTNGTGTTQMILGINAEAAGTCTYLCINRIGDAPKPVEWDNYISTYTPEKYTLPADSALVDIDLTNAVTLVFNEADQYYHLNTADGPVVLVRLLSDNVYTGFAFGNTLLGANVGTYHYDETGTLVKKVLYNDCLQQYLGQISGEGENRKFTNGKCDDEEGVYPLTKDLETILKNYGEYMGYWDSSSMNYLFASVVDLNVEYAWLFACCYAQ